MRGKVRPLSALPARPGSPPRMRGKDFGFCRSAGALGITPAYAGKSELPLTDRSPTGDHPRVCGEKDWLISQFFSEQGSPPRMRGKVACKDGSAITFRITPAYAGKSVTVGSCVAPTGDHPRVCGEKAPSLSGCGSCQGSPPRMRGKVTLLYALADKEGITPAYAGKRLYDQMLAQAGRDHPRVCGEKGFGEDDYTRREGSPPRMRGKDSVLPVLLLNTRGSPPRMRGKAPITGQWAHTTRITPAYAGKRLKRSHRIGHFSCILCLFHSVLHRASASGGSRAGPCAPPCLPAQNAVPV